MISADNKSMQEAGETLFTLNGDNRIRDLCEAREDYRRTWGSVKLDMQEKETIIREKDTVITSLKTQIAELQRQLQDSVN